VLEKIGDVAYKLKLPDAVRLHPIFHISLLKKFHGHYNQHYLLLPLTTSEFGPHLQPEKVLATRVVIQGSTTVQQLLIQW